MDGHSLKGVFSVRSPNPFARPLSTLLACVALMLAASSNAFATFPDSFSDGFRVANFGSSSTT